jgi:hypothetical protein
MAVAEKFPLNNKLAPQYIFGIDETLLYHPSLDGRG